MVPFLNLKAQVHEIREEVRARLDDVIENTQFILGTEVTAFEKRFASWCQTTQAIGVNNGTSALHLALLACDIGPGAEVITTPFTFVATVAAIEYTGAKPVFVDIDPATFNLDPSKLEAAITPRTKAILPVHLYGRPADMAPILAIAKKHSLRVVEDACQAHGAESAGKRVGSLGDMGCFSFYPGKNLGAWGEGGCVVTSDEALARKVRMLRDWGAEKKYEHVLKGFNMRLEGLQAAVLGVKMNHIDRWTERRRALAKRYLQKLAGSRLVLPGDPSDLRHVWHLFVVRTKNRAAFMKHLGDAGIGCLIHYPYPIHLLPAHQDLGYRAGAFPHAEAAAAEVVSLPMCPYLSDAQVDEVAEAVLKYAGA